MRRPTINEQVSAAANATSSLSTLQGWLQGEPTRANNWQPQYRGWLAITLGNLLSDLRYLGWRLRGGKY